jgi:PknH-like extracellular domain
MRNFVTQYYDELPTRPYNAWTKLDSYCQQKTGQRDFLDFWATIQSVTVVSVSPRDATSVVARLRYVRRNGTSDSEDRWFKIVAVNGTLLLDESNRIDLRPTTPPSTMSQPPTTTTVAPDALEGLLLGPDQIGDAMAATGMRVRKSYTAMKELDGELSDKACLPLADPADAAVYAGSRWYAMRGQGLDEASWNHLVYQNVVLFSSANDADAFITASAQRWPTCANRSFTIAQADKPLDVWTVGPVSNTSHMLGATKTEMLGDGWTCHRALTAANNIVIDVQACGKTQYDIGPISAFTIAQQVALKVPTG